MNQREQQSIRVEFKVEYMRPGMILKWDAYSDQGEKILPAGKSISAKMISDFKSRNIHTIYYQKPILISQQNDLKPMIPLKLFAQALSVMDELKNAANQQIKLPVKEIERVVDSFIESILGAAGNTVLNLMEMKKHNTYLYNHAINTSLVSILFGRELGYNHKGIKIIGTGALLHNIGLIYVPPHLIEQENERSGEDWDLIQKAPLFGYEMIKSEQSFGKLIRKIVLCHYERYDGSGYPLGINGDQIGEPTQLVSISSLYNSFVMDKPDGENGEPEWYALSLLSRLSGSHFYPHLVSRFLVDMPLYLSGVPYFNPGTFVALNTGELGEIIALPHPFSIEPIVNIYKTPLGEVRYPIPLDLEFDRTRYIQSIITDVSRVKELKYLRDRFGVEKPETKQKPKIKEEKMYSSQLGVDAKIRAKANLFKIDLDLLEDDETAMK